MKKLLLFLLFACTMIHAQTITFTDPNFKAKLLSVTDAYNLAGVVTRVDTNSNGEIEYTEAVNIRSLSVDNANISDLSGIEAFSNLRSFTCVNNNLTTLNMQNFTQLSNLVCSRNAITSIQLTGSNNLSNFLCDYNQLTVLDLSGFPQLTSVDCIENNITILRTPNCPNLVNVYCEDNPLVTVDFSNCPSMVNINFRAFPDLTSLNIANCTSVINLNVAFTQITALSLAGMTSLTNIFCQDNPLLSSITNINCPNVTSLVASNNNLSAIDLSSMRSIHTIYLDNNPLTALDVSTLTTLTSLSCSNTLITTLNLSNITNLGPSDFSSNPQLQTIFAKNGNTNEPVNLADTPNLIFICADEAQITDFQNALLSSGSIAVVNTYCSFVPGGTYNTINGTVRFDANGNGCDASDAVRPNVRININDTTNQGATFTNDLGEYRFYIPSGSFTLTPSVENSSWFNFSPASAVITFANANNNITTQNFCITPNGSHQDLEVVIQPIDFARPGFDATYRIVYRNKGNTTVSGNITFTFNDAKIDYVTATETPNAIATGSLTWNYSNLIPFESRSVIVRLNVNSPEEIPAVNIDDVLPFGATISPTAADEMVSDNAFTYNQIVVGSYDPNDITCTEGAVIPPSQIGNYLHYVVNFENTGNYMAQNVVVRDLVDTTKYDINSLQLQNTSHQSYTRINGNSVEFIFQDINLAAASGTPRVGGHGDVLFKIKSKNNLVEGNSVSKSAKIYFDYNAPITTNDADTTFRNLSNAVHQLDNSISLYPIPTNSIINIESNSTINLIQLYDIQGRLLETNFADSNTAVFDLSTRQNGLYFLKITTDNGSKIEKIVKQ